LAIVAIIPARFGSTRLPGKPLSDIHGKPMIQHVYERARRARRVDDVIVATDDERILRAVHAFGGKALMTSREHATGTDRLAEAVSATSAEIVVNVQGDEPMLDPAGIDAAIAPMLSDRRLEMSTLSLPLTNVDEMLSPAVVKVVTDAAGSALYFSRSPIPFCRVLPGDELREAAANAVARGLARKHVGLYVYRRATLLRLAALEPSPLEKAEALEQLRALENGVEIHVVATGGDAAQAVDTPEDLERVRALLQETL
jgi:3-deoxy-manno-octulosonate cytidylyltransferase (CMP-KDO synthetase)